MSSKMDEMKLQSVALVLAGIVIGCAVGATVPKTSASSSGNSEWRCFKVSLLPDVERAEGLAEGAGYASVLNQLAGTAPPGTLFQMSESSKGENFMCAKQ